MMKAVLGAAVVSVAIACSTSRNTSVGSANSGLAASNSTAATPRPVGEGTSAPTPRPHDAPRISLAEAKKDFDAGTAVFIDTHAAEQFARQHIPGALNISVSDLAAKENKIPKGKKIIAYCS